MGSETRSTRITILHFNDVYNIEEQASEPVGGAARFKTAVARKSDLDPLILFSGDAFNPSLMSTVNKGKQMVPVLNSIGVHCAVYGNHDFDHGIDALVKLAEDSTFPWLLSNVFDVITNQPLADGHVTHIIDWKGRKIGFIGLVEEEWIATLATIDPDEIQFIDYVEEGQRLAKELRGKGCDYIIALTHMRWHNDTRLAEEADEIDLILGGHDHDFIIKQINGKFVIKSGTDFRQMCQITLDFDRDGHASILTEEILVNSKIPPDPEVQEIVRSFSDLMSEKMEQVLGKFDVDLDGRFSSVRTQETNLGNFITDIMLEVTDSDFALLNSGTLRSDRIHPKGDFKMKDLFAILPMIDPVVVVKVTGSQVIELLENGVSQYPKLEGRFPQVSGITFGFDPEAPPGQRIDARFVMIQGEYLDPEKEYKVATKHYLAEGKDGYTVFKNGTMILNEEEGPRLSTSVQNHFKSVEILQGKKNLHSQHRQSLIPVTKRKSLIKQLSLQEDDFRLLLTPSLSKRASLSSPTGKRLLLRRRSSIQSEEQCHITEMLAPKVEGRIFHLDKMKTRALEEARLAHDVKNTVICEQDEHSVPNTPQPSDEKHF